jgi:WD40 repeat protein
MRICNLAPKTRIPFWGRIRVMKLFQALVAACAMIPAYSASGPELRIQLGHLADITAVEFSPDGTSILTASGDGTARLWDVATGYEIRKFSTEKENWEFGTVCCVPLKSAVFSPDGRQIMTTAADAITIYALDTGTAVRRIKVSTNLAGSAAFLPDGRFVLAATGDDKAHLWDVQSGRELRQFPGGGKVFSVAFSADGKTVLTGGDDNLARSYSSATGREIQQYRGHSGQVTSVAFSPDGQSILTTSDDFTVRLWDLATGAEKNRLAHGDERFACARFSPDGRSVLAAGKETAARLIDVATGDVIRSFNGPSKRHPTSVAISPDGRLGVIGGDDHIARIWDLATGRELRRLEAHSSWVSAVHFSADGRWLFTESDTFSSVDATGGGAISRWDLSEGREANRFVTESVDQVDFSQDGRFVVATNSVPLMARKWDTATGEVVNEFTGHTKFLQGARFSPSSRWVLTFSEDNTVRYYSAKAGIELTRFKSLAPQAVAFSPSGRTVVIASNVSVRMLSVASGREYRRFDGEFSRIFSVAFSPDGRYVVGAGAGPLVAGKYSAPVRLFDWRANRKIRTFDEQSRWVYSAAFSPDSRFLLTGNADCTARLWEVASGRLIQEFVGHSAEVFVVGFSPDGKFVVTGGADCTTRLWETATGQLVATIIQLREGGWAVVAPDGRYDASAQANLPGVYWSEGNKVTGLAQRGEKYFTPGLLAKLLVSQALPSRKSGLVSKTVAHNHAVHMPGAGRSWITRHSEKAAR